MPSQNTVGPGSLGSLETVRDELGFAGGIEKLVIRREHGAAVLEDDDEEEHESDPEGGIESRGRTESHDGGEIFLRNLLTSTWHTDWMKRTKKGDRREK